MIKKRKRKKNPKIDEIPLTKHEIDTLKWSLYNAILYGEPTDLVNSISLLKLGFVKCDDCDKDYYACRCEYCEDCKLNRCLCDWNLNRSSYGSYEVIKFAWNLAKELFDKNYLSGLKKEVLQQSHTLTEYKKMDSILEL